MTLVAEHVAATWQTRDNESIWTSVSEAAVSVGKTTAFIGPVLLLPDPRVCTIFVVRKSGKEILWQLTLDPAPKTEPPDSVRDRAEKLGGPSGLRDLLNSTFADEPIPPLGTYAVHMHLAFSDWRTGVLPRPLAEHDRALNRLADGVELSGVDYRLTNGTKGIGEISVSGFGDSFVLDIVGSAPIDLGEASWLPYAEDIAKLTRDALFERISSVLP